MADGLDSRRHGENRLTAIEKTLAKIENVLEIVIVELRGRITKSEKDISHLESSMYTSCDIKSKEIDEKIAIATRKIWYVIGSLFFLFIGAVIYFNDANNNIYASMNSSHTRIYDKISDNNKPTIENTTNIKVILQTVEKMDDKLDAMNKKNP